MLKFLAFGALFLVLLFPLLIALFGGLLFAGWRFLTYETRFRRFFSKYKNDEIARMVASGKIWTGQTKEQLRDAKGEPLRIEDYGQESIWVYKMPIGNQPMRIIVEEDRVKTWSP